MKSPVITPWAYWLLRIASPRDERAELLAELEEEAGARATSDGIDAARRWYVRQALASAAPLAKRRLSLAMTTLTFADLRLDVIAAIRSLRSAPALSISILILMALGLGAHTAAYAVVDGLMLRPLPFGERSARLMSVHATHPSQSTSWNNARIAYADLLDVRKRAKTLESIEGIVDRTVSVTVNGSTDRVVAASITPGLFRQIGAAPASGRDFTETDAAAPGFESAVIVSHAFWENTLGGDPAALQRALVINGRPLTIVGVMPKLFTFPNGQRLWLPYRAPDNQRRDQRPVLGLALIRSGVSRDQAAAELSTIAESVAAEFPATNRAWGIHIMPLRELLVHGADARRLLAAVTLLLIVIAANVAGLLLARGLGRMRELRVRAALGASRWRLARLLLVETSLLCAVGGALGLCVGAWTIRGMNAWNPEPPPYWAMPKVDMRVALLAAFVTCLVALVCGLAPAIRLSRLGTVAASARSTGAGGAPRRLQGGLVSAQVAISFALLIAAGLLMKSSTALMTADGGFEMDSMLSFRVYVSGDRYDALDRRASVVDSIRSQISQLPGVLAAAATTSIPTDDGGSSMTIAMPGDASGQRELGAQIVSIDAAFFDTLQRPPVQGRTFTAAETSSLDATSILINEKLASRLWPDSTAVGRTITYNRGLGPVTRQIVGVAPNLVYEEFGEETEQSQLIVYSPMAAGMGRTAAVLVRTAAAPANLAQNVRDIVRSIDPGFAVYDVMTMADRRAYNHWGAAFIGRVSEGFAWAALAIAAIGAYGLAAYRVGERRREIGVRLALGAERAWIVRMFLADSARLGFAGIAGGAALAAWIAVSMSHQGALFRTSPWTADIWLAPPAALLAAICLATFLPARRGSRIDPSDALRAD